MIDVPSNVSRGMPILAAAWNQMLAAVRSGRIQLGPHTRGQQTSDGFIPHPVFPMDTSRPYLSMPPPPYGKVPLFGIVIDHAVCTVASGAIRRAGKIYLSDADPVEITITADGQWIGWEFNPVNNTLIILPDPQAAMPEDGDGLARGPLYEMGFAEADEETGALACAWLKRVWQYGVIASTLFGE